MVMLNSFWTPCLYYDSVENAVKPIAFYTAMASVIFITYTVYVFTGGESSRFYTPYFEADVHDSLYIWGSIAIVFFLVFLAASYCLIRGVQSEVRVCMLPWMFCMLVIIIWQLYLGFHWLFDYYIYLENIFAMILLWFWMAYNIYALLVIYSVYQIIVDKQRPAVVVLPEAYTENTLFYWDENV